MFDFVEATFDFVAQTCNNIARVYRKIGLLSFRQSRNKLTFLLVFCILLLVFMCVIIDTGLYGAAEPL